MLKGCCRCGNQEACRIEDLPYCIECAITKIEGEDNEEV